MKPKLTLSILCTFLAASVCAQYSLTKLDSLKNISNFELTAYGPSNSVISKTNYNVNSVLRSIEGEKAIIYTTTRTEKNFKKEKEEFYNSISYSDGLMHIRLRNVIPAYIFEEYNNMDIVDSESGFQFPVDLEIGQQLQDLNLGFELKVAPITHKVNYILKDRVVTRKETINTPAGTFECFVIESQTRMQPKNRNTGSTKQWVNTNFGLIKETDYNASGQLVGMTLVTAITPEETPANTGQHK